MKTYTVLAFLLLAPFVTAHAQDDILREMVKRADLIAKVEVLELVGGMIEEAGVENWTATCKVLTSVKGKLKQGDKIKIDCSRLVRKEKEPLKFEKGKKYIVFLSAKAPADVHHTIDHWVGALSYNLHLFERTQKIANELTKKVQQD